MILQVAMSGEVLDVCCAVKLFPNQVSDSSCGVSGLLPCLPASPGLCCGAPVFPWLCSELQCGPGSRTAPRLCGCLCVCRAGVLQVLLRAASDYWQLLQHLSATAHQDFQANSPEVPSPSPSWPTERLKNFYLWSMDEVTGPEGTVAENPCALAFIMLKAFCWQAFLCHSHLQPDHTPAAEVRSCMSPLSLCASAQDRTRGAGFEGQ